MINKVLSIPNYYLEDLKEISTHKEIPESFFTRKDISFQETNKEGYSPIIVYCALYKVEFLRFKYFCHSKTNGKYSIGIGGKLYQENNDPINLQIEKKIIDEIGFINSLEFRGIIKNDGKIAIIYRMNINDTVFIYGNKKRFGICEFVDFSLLRMTENILEPWSNLIVKNLLNNNL